MSTGILQFLNCEEFVAKHITLTKVKPVSPYILCLFPLMQINFDLSLFYSLSFSDSQN